ncbi:MAG: amidohydrolase family protein, partial [Hyphomonadaceae bacterium]
TDFCTADPRLLAVGFVPLDDFERAAAVAADAMKLGCKAIRVPGRPARGNSPSHIAADRVWAMAQEAGIPIVFHIDGKEAMNKAFFSNGLPAIKDFRGGDSDHSSIGYIQTPNEIMATLTALIFDGVMDRFPKLKFGVIEQGASWAPSWLQWMDATFEAFSRNEERLRKLSERPCDIARRQVRITPFPHENVSWIIANTGPKMILFSSDYPHVEGGRNPLRRFEASLQGASEAAVEGFYTGNFEDLLGAVLSPLLRRGAAA